MIHFDKHIFQMGWNHQPGLFWVNRDRKNCVSFLRMDPVEEETEHSQLRAPLNVGSGASAAVPPVTKWKPEGLQSAKG